MNSDMTLEMMYEIHPRRVENSIILPYLRDFFENVDSAGAPNSYWKYLKIIEQSLFMFDNGTNREEPRNSYERNKDIPYIFQFIFSNIIPRNPEPLQMPNIKMDSYTVFQKDEWAEVYILDIDDDGFAFAKNNPEDISKSRKKYLPLRVIPHEYIERFGKPEKRSQTYLIPIVELLENPHLYTELTVYIENDSFPTKKEYNNLYSYYKKLESMSQRRRFMPSSLKRTKK